MSWSGTTGERPEVVAREEQSDRHDFEVEDWRPYVVNADGAETGGLDSACL